VSIRDVFCKCSKCKVTSPVSFGSSLLNYRGVFYHWTEEGDHRCGPILRLTSKGEWIPLEEVD
jgi:hypothetical protein